MEYTENTKLVAAPTHRHTFRRHYPATAIPPPGWMRLRWWCTKTVNRDFLLVQPTTEVMVHKSFFFSVRPAPRSWSWGSPHRGRATFHWCRESSDPFVRPCHTKGNISLDLRDFEDCLLTKRQGKWWRWWGERPCKVQTFSIHIDVLSLNCAPWRKLWPSWTFEQLLELLSASAHVCHLPNCDKPVEGKNANGGIGWV